MSAFAIPAGRRSFDPRVAIGAALVAVSIAATVGLVVASDSSVTVYEARTPIVAGHRLTAADLVPTRVRLGASTHLYLAAPPPAGGYLVTRAVSAGEMVPMSALGSAASAVTATVVVGLATDAASSIDTGAQVDLWSAPKTSVSGRYGPPVMLVASATVVKRIEPTGFAASRGDSLELQVPRDDVAQVLQAVADGASISAVGVAEPAK